MKKFLPMSKFFISLLLLLGTAEIRGQYSLTLSTYNQDFNTLSNSGTSGILPTGWAFNETGTNANTTYTAGTGSSATADTYSFGSSASSERTFGGLQSGSLNPTIGFYVSNNTGSTITSLTINYTGEQWRLGATGRTDRMDFQYSRNATSLTNGIWIDADALDFTAPVTSGSTGALDGNQVPNRTLISSVVTGLTIPDGTNFFIRWTDFNAAGFDDGLGIDDFSLTASFTPLSTDYFRSASSGSWTSTSTWESSADNFSWLAATSIPSANANNIIIRNGHTVSFAAFLSVDQVLIQNGGTLDFSNGILKVEDGPGDDINIQNGGIFILSSAANPPLFGSGNPAINTNTGGIIKIAASGLTGAGTGVNANNYVYQDQSILEYTLNGGFSSDNVVYFPNANATTIPVFRTTNTSTLLVGATNPTTFNGIFECVGSGGITWQNSGNKIFRNGIRGTDNISANASAASAKFIINGATAELGGTGILSVPTTGGLEIGSGSMVTMSSDKTITGDVSLLANSYVDPGNYNLTVSGVINGGSLTSYIRTAGTGSLTLNNINTTGKTFPIGHSAYNPLLIENGSNHNWTARVNDGVVADPPNGITGAVLLTWYISPSVNPPAAGANITFQFDKLNQTGSDFNTPPYNTPDNVQAWHRKQGYWLAAGTPVPLVNVSGNIWSAKISGLTQFSPYALSRISLPLPIKLISFNAAKINSGLANLTWELARPCSAAAGFEAEKSTDGRRFISFTTIPGIETNRFYNFNDSRLAKGITYYRLKMIDADGTVSYSKIVVIINDNKGLLITSLAPDPVRDKAVISITSARAATVQFSIYNMSGNIVKQWYQSVREGSSFPVIELAQLAAGLYHLCAAGYESSTVISFIRQ